ncbi:MAG: hypothetical protein ABWX84_15070 [Nocardioides sp.]
MDSFDRHIHTQAELEAAWRDLVTPLGWGSPRFWIMLIGPSGRPLPQLIEIDELDGPPQDDDVERGAQFLRMLAGELGIPDPRVAFLYARPGSEGTQALDRRWATSLAAMARRAGLVCEPVHLANDVRIVAIPLDELDAA